MMSRLKVSILVAAPLMVMGAAVGAYFWRVDLCAFPVGQVRGQSKQVAIDRAMELITDGGLNVSYARAREQDARAIPALLKMLEEQSGSPKEPKIIQLLSYMGAAELLPKLEQVLSRSHGNKMTFDEFRSIIAATAAHGHLAATGCDSAFDFLEAATDATYWREIGFSGAYGSNTEEVEAFELRCQVLFTIATTRRPRGLELLRKLEMEPPAFATQDQERQFRESLKAAVEHYHELIRKGPRQVWKEH